MGDVVELDVNTTLPLPPDRILRGATEEGLVSVVICGVNAKGEFWFSALEADGAEILWLLKLAGARLMREALDQEQG